MTKPDPTDGSIPDADPVDELASALVDGEATAAERARAAEPEVAARVADFEVVSRLVGTPVDPPAPPARDAAVGAALAAAEQAPVDLAASRRRRRLAAIPASILKAAAAVAVVAGLAVAVAALGDSDGGDEAAQTSAADAQAEAGTEAPGSGTVEDTASTAPAGGESAPAAPPSQESLDRSTGFVLTPLGAFPDEESLLDAARSLYTAASGAGGDAQLRAVACADRFDPGVTSTATARLRERPVVVTVAAGQPAIVVYDAETCTRILVAAR